MTKIIGIAAGICAILAGLFSWWGQYLPYATYGFGIIEQLLPNYTSMLTVPIYQAYTTWIIVFYIALIASGVLIFLAALTYKKMLSLIGLIPLIAAFVGQLVTLSIWANKFGLYLFHIYPTYFESLGPGFFLGIAALVLTGFFLLALRKSTAKASA